MSMLARLGATAAFVLTLSGAALAQSAPEQSDSVAATPTQIEFIQQAGGMNYADGKLTLRDPAPLTLFFADRPSRFTGQMRNSDFAKYWDASADGFANDPPNAAVMVSNVDNPPAIVELTSFTLQDSGDIVYEVKVLEGEVPANGEAVALFIDPVAYVGPRVSFYAGPHVAAGVVHPPRPPVVVHAPPPPRVVVRPRCHYSPYYSHDVCRMY